VICNSQFTADGVAEAGVAGPGVVVHPPVPAPPPVAAASRPKLRASLNVPDDASVILQVGRMEPGKGHQVMLDALARIRDRPDWVAWQVGGAQRDEETSYVGALAIAAARLGVAARVRFLGDRRDVPEVMAAADIYCQPNVAPESFGITFIEALYAGLPVLTSTLGAAGEIVDQSCGAMVPAGDPSAVADVLRAWLADPSPRRVLGAAGPKRAATLCNPRKQLEQLYNALAGQAQA
jgi:glycosyltransferase involved in cell wall biosynthesis